MAGPLKGNKNAQKGESNRVVFSTRLPAKTKGFIKEESELLEISQSDLIILVLKIYEQNKHSIQLPGN